MIPKICIPLSAVTIAIAAAIPALSLETTQPQISTILDSSQPSVHDLAQTLAESSVLNPNSDLSHALMLAQTTGSEVAGDTFSPQQSRKNLLIEPLILPSSRKPSPAPGSTFGVPSAYGANWRDVFFGGGFISRGNTFKDDGSIGFGGGFGDASKTVGVEIGADIISLTNSFADSGSVGFKVHKVFPSLDNLAIAVGWTNPITWGSANKSKDEVYGVVTKSFELQPGKTNTLPLTVTAGIGTGSFRSLGTIKAGHNDPSFFASLGLRVIPQVSLISSWTGSQLNMGVSAAPFSQVPFTVTLGAADVTNNRGNLTRFLMSAGFGFRL